MVPLWCLVPLIVFWAAACIAPYYWAKTANSKPKRKWTPQDDREDDYWDTIALLDAIDRDWDERE